MYTCRLNRKWTFDFMTTLTTYGNIFPMRKPAQIPFLATILIKKQKNTDQTVECLVGLAARDEAYDEAALWRPHVVGEETKVGLLVTEDE